MTPRLSSLDHLVLTVADIANTIAFYENVLGMEVKSFVPVDGSTRWSLAFGSQKINLHQQGAEFDPKALAPTPGSADLCFLSETSLQDWQTHLFEQNVDIEMGPIQRTGAIHPILSLYVRDPDQNLIEISVVARRGMA